MFHGKIARKNGSSSSSVDNDLVLFEVEVIIVLDEGLVGEAVHFSPGGRSGHVVR